MSAPSISANDSQISAKFKARNDEVSTGIFTLKYYKTVTHYGVLQQKLISSRNMFLCCEEDNCQVVLSYKYRPNAFIQFLFSIFRRILRIF